MQKYIFFRNTKNKVMNRPSKKVSAIPDERPFREAPHPTPPYPTLTGIGGK